MPFVWDTDCDIAFNKIKELIVSAPVLHPQGHFTCGQMPVLKVLVLYWNSVLMMARGILSHMLVGRPMHLKQSMQRLNGKLLHSSVLLSILKCICWEITPLHTLIIKLWSRHFSPLVYAVEHFEVYLLGSHTTVYTDHQALVTAFLSHMKNWTKGLLRDACRGDTTSNAVGNGGAEARQRVSETNSISRGQVIAK